MSSRLPNNVKTWVIVSITGAALITAGAASAAGFRPTRPAPAAGGGGAVAAPAGGGGKVRPVPAPAPGTSVGAHGTPGTPGTNHVTLDIVCGAHQTHWIGTI